MTVGAALGDVQMTPPVVAPPASSQESPTMSDPSELSPLASALTVFGTSNEAGQVPLVDVVHLTACVTPADFVHFPTAILQSALMAATLQLVRLAGCCNAE